MMNHFINSHNFISLNCCWSLLALKGLKEVVWQNPTLQSLGLNLSCTNLLLLCKINKYYYSILSIPSFSDE